MRLNIFHIVLLQHGKSNKVYVKYGIISIWIIISIWKYHRNLNMDNNINIEITS